LLASALLASACEVATVVGYKEFNDEASDGHDDPTGPWPNLDTPLADCEPPAPASCDSSSHDPLQVVGLDCIGGIPASGGFSGPDGALGIHTGELGPYAPREGEKFVILSTGRAAHLPMTHEELGCADPDTCPSTNFGVGPADLPPPIDVTPVDDEVTCVDDPSLVGMGDCSNSLFGQWTTCGGGCEVWDYAELRVGLTVPDRTHGLAFDFAFLSAEWPSFVGGGFNDMFVAWLESERWTGNVSFDEAGNPITVNAVNAVNAGFTGFTGAELAGFAMEGHAGTRWLTTAFGLIPGETIELVLAVFDLSDGALDSVVLLDGFRWTCTGAPPTTSPVP
jgi:hypothetical protein